MNHLREQQTSLFEGSPIPKRFTIWKHYKGELYFVIGITMQESTEQLNVCYFPLKKSQSFAWSRPLSQWNEIINNDENKTKRFTQQKLSTLNFFSMIRRILF